MKKEIQYKSADMGTRSEGMNLLSEEKRDLFLAASLNEEKTHDNEGKLMLDAYLTDRLGICDFDGKEQLYKQVGDKVAKPSAEEQSCCQEIEQVLLTEKIEDDKKQTSVLIIGAISNLKREVQKRFAIVRSARYNRSSLRKSINLWR